MPRAGAIAKCQNDDHGSCHVAILMCTLDGERFLAEQLASIADQTHRDWSLHVSDDRSSDGTCAMVARFAKAETRNVSRRDGPARGPTANFMSLLHDPTINADAYAFCDQDDVWDADKLARGLSWLSGAPPRLPALWCSRTRLIDDQGRDLGLSPAFEKPPGFRNALVQNVGGGNTMLFNSAARDILMRGPLVDVVAHDWWTYKIVSGTGGRVHYDLVPSVSYRQHANNVIGANFGLQASLKRVGMLMRGRLAAWNDIDIDALDKYRPLLTPENQLVFDTFKQLRSSNPVARLAALRTGQFYRQTKRGQAALVGAVLAGLV